MWLVWLRNRFLISVNAHLVLTHHVWLVAPVRDRKPQGVDRRCCEVAGTRQVLGQCCLVSVDMNLRTFVLAFSRQLLSTCCVRAPRSASLLMQVMGPPGATRCCPNCEPPFLPAPGVTPLHLGASFPHQGHLCSPFP